MVFMRWKNGEIKESKSEELMEFNILRWREQKINDNRKTKEVLRRKVKLAMLNVSKAEEDWIVIRSSKLGDWLFQNDDCES